MACLFGGFEGDMFDMSSIKEFGATKGEGDHVSEMEGDALLSRDAIPGYSTLGRLFANGYLKALLKGTNHA